jgi:Domain of unknown function (DUF5916)/Carbohydrate family 9 binding domain-like
MRKGIEAMKRLGWIFASLLIVCICACASRAAAVETRSYTTSRAAAAPRIDGQLTDAVWSIVDWTGDFTEHKPDEGSEPTAQTWFKILYNDQNLYIAYRAFDPQPELINEMLGRRDYFPGDWVEINIDSYFDHRTAFSFTTSVSGVQGDEFISNDGENWDSNWNPIWECATAIDDQGWTAEVRIPLSQLRYSDKVEQVWGIQVTRRIYREEERSTWQFIPRETTGFVSKFGELRGIHGIRAQKQIELMPYIVTSGERFAAEADNPFADGSRGKISAGVDGKLGVTGDLTLDFTINPDFGQVEADPSQVNLTAFETFFQEKRPFFIEGNNIFSFRLAPSNAYGTHTQDRLFYSRRVGGKPHYRADWYEAGSVDQPTGTSILGACKLSGKNKNGLSLGIIESVTQEEKAEIDNAGQRRKLTVEPLTNYFVGRLQQDFNRGGTRIGAMITAVNRKIDTPELNDLHEGAYVGGVDFFHYLADRNYYLALNLATSHVTGSEEAMVTTQTAAAHYFQRPDNEGQAVDSTSTSLSGHGGSLRLGKSSGNFMYEGGAAWRSAGLEMNDAGFMRNADELNQFLWVGYRLRNPFSIFNEMSINGNQWIDWELGGERLYRAFNGNIWAEFRNRWSFNGSISRELDRISNSELRGGPSIRMPGNYNGNIELNTDRNMAVSGSVGTSRSVRDEDSGDSNSYWFSLNWRPTNALRLNLHPQYSRSQNDTQYVSTEMYESDPRYLYGAIDQETFNLSFRIDYAITPDLTVQYYGSPFISAASYDEFKRITAPRSADLENRYSLIGDQLDYNAQDGTYNVDEDNDGSADYGFSSPDFNFKDFNSNLVMRWEYSPGSSIYLVWSQARSGYVGDASFDLNDDLHRLFDVHPHNVFLIKINRWFDI